VRQYEIWWADLPPPVGRRPVLLLSREGSYAYLTRVLVVEVTTTVRGIGVELPLGRREGLVHPCVANFDNLRSVPRARLSTRLGRLAPVRVREAKRALGHALGWIELTSADA
jgi:mRNA interferase MazF